MIILYTTAHEYAKNIDIGDYAYPLSDFHDPPITVKPFRLIDDPTFIVNYDETIFAKNINYISIIWDQPLHDNRHEFIKPYLPINDLNTVFYIKYIKQQTKYISDGHIYKTPSDITI